VTEPAGAAADGGGAPLRVTDEHLNAALDELLESGALEDDGGGDDDIQKELDEVASKSNVDQELAALKAEMASSPAIGSGSDSTAPN